MLVKYPKGGQLIMCYNDKFEMTSGNFLQQLKQPVLSPEGSNIKMREVDTLAYYTKFLDDLESSGACTLHTTYIVNISKWIIPRQKIKGGKIHQLTDISATA